MASFSIPAHRLDGLRAAIASLAKRAAKLAEKHGIAIETPRLIEGATASTGGFYRCSMCGFTARFPHGSPEPCGCGSPVTGFGKWIGPFSIQFTAVEISGSSPQVPGWKFLASLDHTAHAATGQNIVRVPIGTDEAQLPIAYRSARAACDHCGVYRPRNRTFVLRENATGRAVQIGADCARDFLGHPALEEIAALCEMISELARKASDDDRDGALGTAAPEFDLGVALPYVRCVMREHGWVSATVARERGIRSTAHIAETCGFSPGRNVPAASLLQPTPEDRARAADDIAFATQHIGAKAADARSNYEHNLLACILAGAVSPKNFPLAASLCVYADRARGEIREKTTAREPQHIGTVGEKLKIEVTIEGSSAFETQYGWSYYHRFKTADGDQIVWRTSTSIADLDHDASYELQATIKSHDAWQGRARTVVTRAVLRTAAEVAAAAEIEASKRTRKRKAA